MTYKDLILHFARVHNRRIRFFDVSWLPVAVEILCRIYAYWLHFFISVPVNITSLLLNSMKSDVVCSDHEIKKLLPFEPLDFKTAVTWAKEKENQSRVFSHWSDVPPDQMNELMPLCKFEASEFVIGEHSVTIPADPETIFPVMCRIGGEHGWAHANILWEIRGLIDRILGGVGLHRGRRDSTQLKAGDSVDFWRVEKLDPNRELLLRAEMISPGLSWLQFELEPLDRDNTRITLRAHFVPKPFWGHLYWAAMSHFHAYIFKGMLSHFRKECSQMESHVPVLEEKTG